MLHVFSLSESVDSLVASVRRSIKVAFACNIRSSSSNLSAGILSFLRFTGDEDLVAHPILTNAWTPISIPHNEVYCNYDDVEGSNEALDTASRIVSLSFQCYPTALTKCYEAQETSHWRWIWGCRIRCNSKKYAHRLSPMCHDRREQPRYVRYMPPCT